MDLIGAPVFQFAIAASAVGVAAYHGFEYFRGRIPRLEFMVSLLAGAVLFSYGSQGVATFLSLPQYVSRLLAGFGALWFLGVFLYWAYCEWFETSG